MAKGRKDRRRRAVSSDHDSQDSNQHSSVFSGGVVDSEEGGGGDSTKSGKKKNKPVDYRSLWNEYMDLLMATRVGRRRGVLEWVVNGLTTCYLGEEIVQWSDTLTSLLPASILKCPSLEEASLACRCLGALLISRGKDEIGANDYDQLARQLSHASLTCKTRLIKSSSAELLGLLGFLGCNDDGKLEEMNNWFVSKCSGEDHVQMSSPIMSNVHLSPPTYPTASSSRYPMQLPPNAVLSPDIDLMESNQSSSLQTSTSSFPSVAVASCSSIGNADSVSGKMGGSLASSEFDGDYFEGFLKGWMILATQWRASQLADWDHSPASELFDFALRCLQELSSPSLSSNCKSLKVTCGYTFALLYEAKWGVSESRSATAAELQARYGDIPDLLKSVAYDEQGLKKGDRKSQRLMFRDVLNTVEDGVGPNQSLCLGGRERYVTFNSWVSYIRYDLFRDYLKGSLSDYMISNPSVIHLVSGRDKRLASVSFDYITEKDITVQSFSQKLGRETCKKDRLKNRDGCRSFKAQLCQFYDD